jgi:methyl-accepting chemotaxis protein
MVTLIATAATEQAATAEEINGNIEQIAKIAAGSAAGAQQTTQALQDLADLASNLQGLVGQFHLAPEADGGVAGIFGGAEASGDPAHSRAAAAGTFQS